MKKASLNFLALASVAATQVAWDWMEEDDFRAWRPDSLTWAQDIHTTQMTTTYIKNNYDPPTAEPWCVENPVPTTSDCTEFTARLKTWIRDYRGWSPLTPVPQVFINTFPHECASICS